MTSFVNLMGSDVWSEADIVRRTEAMIHSEFPPEQEGILNRVVTAAAIGQYTLTDEEQAELARYNQVCLDARAAGEAARADNGLLIKALAYEQAKVVVDAADVDTLALVEQRSQNVG